MTIQVVHEWRAGTYLRQQIGRDETGQLWWQQFQYSPDSNWSGGGWNPYQEHHGGIEAEELLRLVKQNKSASPTLDREAAGRAAYLGHCGEDSYDEQKPEYRQRWIDAAEAVLRAAQITESEAVRALRGLSEAVCSVIGYSVRGGKVTGASLIPRSHLMPLAEADHAARRVLAGQPEEPEAGSFWRNTALPLMDQLAPHIQGGDTCEDTLRRLLAERDARGRTILLAADRATELEGRIEMLEADLRSRREVGGVDVEAVQATIQTLRRYQRLWSNAPNIVDRKNSKKFEALADRLTAALRGASKETVHVGTTRVFATADGSLSFDVTQSPALRSGEQAGAEPSWTCFHCGKTFVGDEAAAEHFGRREDADPPECISTKHPLVVNLRRRVVEAEARLQRVEEVRTNIEAWVRWYDGAGANALPEMRRPSIVILRSWAARLADAAPENPDSAPKEEASARAVRREESRQVVRSGYADARDPRLSRYVETGELPTPEPAATEAEDRRDDERDPRYWPAADRKTWRPLRSISELQELDLVRHVLHRGEALIVHENYGSYAFAVRTYHVSNPNEWEFLAVLDRAEKEATE